MLYKSPDQGLALNDDDENPGYSDEGGYIKFLEFKPIEKPSFSEYLKSGWNINLSVAIDFTASNKDPTDPESLHRIDPIDPDFKNEYEMVMEHVGSILEPYAFQ